jgi:hypothetical protein
LGELRACASQLALGPFNHAGLAQVVERYIRNV